MKSKRTRWIAAACALLAIGAIGLQSLERTALAGTACVKDDDCYASCTKAGRPQVVYKCVSATQAGFGFSNACVWPTVSNTIVTSGGAPGNSTRAGLVYVACQ